ncbi:DUF974-domain-containing protein [Ramaria rubella]|nr:DUF974-domain-containing protein [Ramaria rubella]
MDAPGHLLSLKVMRVSRPTLASSWQPFFTSSPSFSAHATDSLLSLQGKEPLPGHPKTLRDLTHASQLLTLPSTFGAIQLGETFTSCLCVNNDAAVEVEGVSLRIEMQTATNKVLLAEVGGPGQRLNTTDVLEAIVSHEMKELGQHVLACYVSYRLPSSVRFSQGPTGDSVDPTLQTFRKYYKFVATNPLNVKTKVHVPRSPTALLSRIEREKVFLEIHVQNLTQEPMWFERMRFECVDGWEVVDGNISQLDGKNLFLGAIAIMQPQDIRQYVYILTPKSAPSFPVVHTPGTIIPLGRLDLAWRSSFGEPGRLLTSLLTRRIPIPAQIAPSAIPPHLQPARPRSPQQPFSRPTSPPGSPTPFKPRPPSHQARPGSPASFTPPSPAPSALPDLEVDLVVRSIPHSDIALEQPFKVTFELTVSGILPTPGKTRYLHLMVQHLQPARISSLPPIRGSTPTLPIGNSSPRPSLDIQSPGPHPPESASPTMSPRRGTFNFTIGLAQALNESPVTNMTTESVALPEDVESRRSSTAMPSRTTLIRLPSPLSSSARPQSVLALGTSVLSLPPFLLSQPQPATPTPDAPTRSIVGRGESTREFECMFVPMRKGFATVGGLRVLLIEDREVEDANSQDDVVLISHINAEAKILREWDIVGEIWVAN